MVALVELVVTVFVVAGGIGVIVDLIDRACNYDAARRLRIRLVFLLPLEVRPTADVNLISYGMFRKNTRHCISQST